MTKLIYSSTDSERLQILKAFYNRLPLPGDEDSIYSQDQIVKIEKHYNIFDKLRAHEEFLRQQQEKQDKEFNDLYNKASLFVTHYYKSLSMAIERGELPAAAANYYGLNYPFAIPTAKDSEDLLEIAENLFAADAMRIGTGGKYFSNPSIGAVNVWVEKFREAYNHKTNKFNVKKAEVENIENIRHDADTLIFELHALLDEQFEVIDHEEQIQLFAEYGMKTKPGKKTSVKQIEAVEPDDKDNCKNGGNTGMNQLKFDLFFPER